MSFVRVLSAALVGGVVVFGWGYTSHEVLGTSKMAFDDMPTASERAVVDAMQGAVQEHSAFLFPMPPDEMLSKEQWEAHLAIYEQGPRGMVIFDPTTMSGSFSKLLGTEFLSGTIAALMAAIVASCVCGGYWGRVATVFLMGLFAWVSIDLSYWNWYRFPDGFALAGLVDQGVGWLMAGLCMAGIARPRCCASGACCQPVAAA